MSKARELADWLGWSDRDDIDYGRSLQLDEIKEELLRLAIMEDNMEKIYSMTPAAYRYTASGHTKWHYQEKFPSANQRGQIKNCGRIEGLFVLPIHPNTPD